MVLGLRATLLPFFACLSISLTSVVSWSTLTSAQTSLSTAASNRVSVNSFDAAESWEYHTVSGARCRDGSEAGYYLKRRTFENRLLIFMEGGGACFNALTCSQSPPNMGNQFPGQSGILAARDDNPLNAWNTMYVPYCTGDVFVGSRNNVRVPGVRGLQQFVGHDNLKLFLNQLGEQLPDPETIVVSGISAGGFGAAFNLPTVQSRWPNSAITLLDDSGLLLEDAYLRPCLQSMIRGMWGIDDVLPRDCTNCRNADGGGLSGMIGYIQEKFGDRQQGAVLSTSDSVLRIFFGFSLNECRPFLPFMPASTYSRGVRSLKANVLQGSIKSFIVPGETHTFISDNRFYQTRQGGQSLASWVGDLLEQKAKDRGVR